MIPLDLITLHQQIIDKTNAFCMALSAMPCLGTSNAVADVEVTKRESVNPTPKSDVAPAPPVNIDDGPLRQGRRPIAAACGEVPHRQHEAPPLLRQPAADPLLRASQRDRARARPPQTPRHVPRALRRAGRHRRRQAAYGRLSSPHRRRADSQHRLCLRRLATRALRPATPTSCATMPTGANGYSAPSKQRPTASPSAVFPPAHSTSSTTSPPALRSAYSPSRTGK